MYKVYQLNIGKETYIGCTSRPIATRLAGHRGRANSVTNHGYNLPISKAIRKAGLFEMTATILHQFKDKSQAYRKEAMLIKKHQPTLNVQGK